MQLIKISFLCLFILCCLSVESFAFRCGSGLVASGDSKVQVAVTCGQPTSKEKSCEGRQTSSRTDKKGKTVKSQKCSNKVDIWYYNCGDNDYIYALTFENGILKKESTEGKGNGKSNCQGK